MEPKDDAGWIIRCTVMEENGMRQKEIWVVLKRL